MFRAAFRAQRELGFEGQRCVPTGAAGAPVNSSNNLMSWMGYILIARTLVPPEIRYVLRQCWALLMRSRTGSFCVFHVYRRHKQNGRKNDLFRVVESYLNVAGLYKEADEMVLATKSEKEKVIRYKLTGKERIDDKFKGVTVWWTLTDADEGAEKKQAGRGGKAGDGSSRKKRKEFILKMHKKDKEFVMTEYLDHVVQKVKEHKRAVKELSLYPNGNSSWKRRYPFKHPSTFDTLAMDPEVKAAVKADLDKFRDSEAYFRRVGRAWKRGYLLYGPPGTGKSSMIAAIANYLKYDVYDLELTQVRSNDGLKKLFRHTHSKSILVIEDIDCTLNLTRRSSKYSRPHDAHTDVTLSGLLNATDGLWATSGEERIIIFTTNHRESLEPALIRPGRMDMHIHMSHCSVESLQELARGYLGVDSEHPAFDAIRDLMERQGRLITPAQATEHMVGSRDDPDGAMRALVAELRKPPREAASSDTEESASGDDDDEDVAGCRNPEAGAEVGRRDGDRRPKWLGARNGGRGGARGRGGRGGRGGAFGAGRGPGRRMGR